MRLKGFKEARDEGDQISSKEILELCDGTEQSVDDALKVLKTFMAEATKDTEDAIKKGMKDAEELKESEDAVGESKASGSKRKGSAVKGSAKNKRRAR